MNARIAKLCALSRAERKLLLLAALLLPVFWIALRALGLRRLHAWIDRLPAIRHTQSLEVEPGAIGTLVNAAGRYSPGPSTCLTRSLLLRWLLRGRGVCSELRIGVRLQQGEFQAHAWVEHQGRPINDAVDIALRFTPIDTPRSYRFSSCI